MLLEMFIHTNIHPNGILCHGHSSELHITSSCRVSNVTVCSGRNSNLNSPS